MAATYNDADATDKDKARSALQDTDMAKPLFSDEHIEAVITDCGSLNAAVAQLAQELITRFARKPVQIKAGQVAVDYRERIPRLKDLVNQRTTVAVSTESLGTVSVPIQSAW